MEYGQAGRGFAVVAEEVRSLAAKSAQAAGQTAEMVEDSIQKVQKGAALAEDTEQALQLIRASIEKVMDLSREVEKNSKEQAGVASQIDEALTQVSSVIQTNSSMSEQCAAASEELSGQTGELNAQLLNFRLKRADGDLGI